MGEIVPRWEWRTFGREIGIRIDPADYNLVRTVSSSEVYLASAAATGNVKIRDSKIDLKVLQQEGEDGLQQWMPVLKAPFPLSAEQVEVVFGALAVPHPSLAVPCDCAHLLSAIAGNPDAWAVGVDKERRQYDVDGCTVEVSRVSFDGDVFETVAAEHADPALVRRVVARLGVQGRDNMSYVEAIRRARLGELG